MKTKLYTVDINGVEHEVATTCAVAELKPVTEYPEKEQFVRAMKGLQSASVECEVTIPDDVAAELRKRHATWNAISSAVLKLRKACCKCRWCVLEREGKHKRSKRITHWYCKSMRLSFSYQPLARGLHCEHFKRKSKSKQ